MFVQVKWLKITPWIIIAVLVILLIFKGCGKTKTDIKVKVPEVTGKFDNQKPVERPTPDIEYVIEYRDREIKTSNPVNDSLLNAYINLEKRYKSDSLELERLRMYVDAIQIREFKNSFEDDYIKLDVFSKAQGYVKDVRIDYKIKEREIIHELESASLRLLIGGQLGINQGFSSFPYKFDLGFQNAKGNMIEGSYMRFNQENYIMLGGKILLFELK